MIDNRDFLILMMAISYILPIYIITKKCSSEGIKPSISSIISIKECKRTIFCGMVVMSIFTILYELNRNNYTSLYSIIGVLLGIGGVIFIDENKKIHYLFAGLVFISIMIFMLSNCYINQCDFLNLSFYIQILLCILLILSMTSNTDKDTDKDTNKDTNKDTDKGDRIFFCTEVLLLINFSVFYIYLHFYKRKTII